ncbi:MAG: hypothetical protein OEW64_03805 [Gammaproteobacteria bacterium]|nr:hypothetical protein [Gammaproteobacteria bacterium]MDH5303203.1 hypothetical protein [Gammaproteobacteria bacterium]MDH5322264.1 hypothetical protein [Gammaproteobacteria bacterium]
MRILRYALILALVTSTAWSQHLPGLPSEEVLSAGEGWRGLTDFAFMAKTLWMLALAAVLATVLALHPYHGRMSSKQDDIAAPNVFAMYAAIGALIGILVVKYGLVLGFVLFGIGGLFRFRSSMGSARLTGHLIFVTLIGLSCGLNLPHVAVLATAFGYGLIWVFNTQIIYRIDVRGLHAERFDAAAGAYREALEQQGCRIMSEKKRPDSGRITYLLRGPRRLRPEDLGDFLERKIDAALRGSVDWEID